MKRIKYAFSMNSAGALLLGLALGSMCYFGLESQNEHNFLDRVNRKIEMASAGSYAAVGDDQFISDAVHYTYYLLQRRSEIFRSTSDDTPLKEKIFHSPIRAAIDGDGECGGYSTFLMSLLDRKGYNVKPCQMNVNGNYGGHITVCVQLPGRLVVVDPLYNETFADANGRLSDINTVSEHWPFYRARITNEQYKDEYDYSKGYRFTNWDKFGFATRGIYASLSFFGGKDWADTISFRRYILDTYQIGFMISALYVCLYLLLNMGKVITALRRRFLGDFKFEMLKPSQGSFQHTKAA
jgi:hypothetical protein